MESSSAYISSCISAMHVELPLNYRPKYLNSFYLKIIGM